MYKERIVTRKKSLIAGITGGGIGGIIGAYIGSSHGQVLGYSPYFIAFMTGVCAIAFAILISKVIG
jgi:outer membrane lipoprotein SlyB